MRLFDYIILIILLMGVGFLYRRYIDKYEMDDEFKQYELIKNYLLNGSSITRENKPIIWIHIPYEYKLLPAKNFLLKLVEMMNSS